MKKTQRCTCLATFTLDGEERIEWPDPSCPRHGLTDSVHKHPLAKYARCPHGHTTCVRNDCFWSDRETPRQVQERLYAEAVAS